MALLRAISAGDPVSSLALEGLEETCPILQDAQFYTRGGSAERVKVMREGAVKTKITRSLNEDNAAVKPVPSYDTPAKKIVSFDSTADVILEDRNEEPEAELAVQTRLDAREAGWVLQEMFFEGDDAADAEDFDGMRNLVDAAWLFTDGLYVPVGNSDGNVSAQQLAIEKFMQAIARVRGGATHVYMNEYLKMRWLTVAKTLGYYRQSKDELGNAIDMIGNTIIRGAGYSKAGTPLLPFTETGSKSSMFFARWGERTNMTLLTSVGVKARYAGQTGNQIINNVNLDAVMYLQDVTSLVQVSGWSIELP